jgi:signal transduction histidine kinase
MAAEPDQLLVLAIDELAAGLDEIRELASGLHPAVLAERGLVAALEALALRAPVPVEVHAVPAEQLPEQVEAAAYYLVAEALANVHKHACAGRIVVRATTDERCLVITVVDDESAERMRQERGCAGSPIASRRSGVGSRSTVPQAVEPGFALRSPTACRLAERRRVASRSWAPGAIDS